MCPITGMKHHSAWGESSPAGRLVAGSNGWWISRKQDDASGCRGSDCASSKGRCIALVDDVGGKTAAERLRLRNLAHALELWNENTGALSKFDIDPLPHQIHLVHHILGSGNLNWLIAEDRKSVG